MISRDHLVQYLDELLDISSYRDYSPNGLQVEGVAEIGTMISGVSACQALLEVAVERNADAVLVHHGYFWKGESPCLVGIQRQRLATLLKHDINLIAYHLPLDGHETFGNNVQLAKLLGLSVDDRFGAGELPPLAHRGRLHEPLTGSAFAQHIEKQLQRSPMHIPGRAEHIETVAWCTGSAPDFIEAAAQLGVDAYITGEIAERTVHQAREYGIHLYVAGHHATERDGVRVLSAHIAKQFDITCEFVDIDNPI